MFKRTGENAERNRRSKKQKGESRKNKTQKASMEEYILIHNTFPTILSSVHSRSPRRDTGIDGRDV